MRRKTLIVTAGVAVAALAWWAFRPELLFINMSVNETLAEPSTLVAQGVFHGVAHETRGTAAIHTLSNGQRVLRLSDFATSNGPDVRVLLIAASDANDSDTVTKAGYIEIAPLKGNIGDQNYDLPKDLDLTKFRAVTIWCNRFSVNFATASLSS